MPSMDEAVGAGMTPDSIPEPLRTKQYGHDHTHRPESVDEETLTTLDPDTGMPAKKRRRHSVPTPDQVSKTDRPDTANSLPRDFTVFGPPFHGLASPSMTNDASSDSEPSALASSVAKRPPMPSLALACSFQTDLLVAEDRIISTVRPVMTKVFREMEEHKAHKQPKLYESYQRLKESLDDDHLFAQFETDPRPDCDDLPYPKGEFKSLLISEENLTAATTDGKGIHERYATIKISGTAQDASRNRSDYSKFCRRVGTALSESQFQYQNFEGQNISFMSGLKLFELLNENLKETQRRDKAPINILSLSGFTLYDSNPPDALQDLDYDLMGDLLVRIRAKCQDLDGRSDPAGKEQRKGLYLSDLEACLSFLLYGQRGSLSMWHMDILNGTWVRCVSGIKLWFVYTGPYTDEVKNDFAEQGIRWTPPKGTVKCYVLRPGDTLIMRPGYPIIHSVITLEDSLMTGGMMWPRAGISKVMENLHYIMKNPRVTNEEIARQLPHFLNELVLLMGENTSHIFNFTNEDKRSVETLINALYPTFSCATTCKGGCKATCPCRVKREDKNPGCSVWCHSRFALNPDDGCSGPLKCDCRGPCRSCACTRASQPCGELCHKCTCGNKAKDLECIETCSRYAAHANCKNRKKGVVVKVEVKPEVELEVKPAGEVRSEDKSEANSEAKAEEIEAKATS